MSRNPITSNAAPAGFTFVEMVVALGIGAMVVAVGAMAYGTIASNGISRRQIDVHIGADNASAFYGAPTNDQFAVSEAPSFTAAAMATSLRQRLYDDMLYATAIVCLARSGPNTIRPTNFLLPANLDARTLVSPEDFRNRLIDTNAGIYTNFSTNSLGNGVTFANNSTIYVLYAGTSSTNIAVDAIYESDWVGVTNGTPGVYASVRRYVGTTMTDYYHVFYPVDNPDGAHTNGIFSPIQRPVSFPAAAFFSRAGTTNGDSRYRIAENQPFYFIWWPDPMGKSILSQHPDPTQAAKILSPTNASDYYTLQFGAASYFLVLPAFPSL